MAFLVLSTLTVNWMSYRDKASDGLKTARRVQKLSIKEKEKGRGQNGLME